MPNVPVETDVTRSLGPPGGSEMWIFSASSGFCFSIVRYELMGFWIQETRPDACAWLFAVSSQESTSSVIVFLYSSRAYSTACLVSGELSVTVLPSLAT